MPERMNTSSLTANPVKSENTVRHNVLTENIALLIRVIIG
jgi:hypothetical protein